MNLEIKKKLKGDKIGIVVGYRLIYLKLTLHQPPQPESSLGGENKKHT